jgi:hypothetical protein
MSPPKDLARRHAAAALLGLALAAAFSAAAALNPAGLPWWAFAAAFCALFALSCLARWVSTAAQPDTSPALLRRLETIRSYLANEPPSYEQPRQAAGKGEA